MLVFAQDEQYAVFSSLGPWIADRPILCWLIAWATFVFEFGFIAAVFSRRARRVILLMAVGFHVGVLFTMNIFFPNVPQLLVFVNWDWLRERLRRSPKLNRDPAPITP
jgi:hypothetical protein